MAALKERQLWTTWIAHPSIRVGRQLPGSFAATTHFRTFRSAQPSLGSGRSFISVQHTWQDTLAGKRNGLG